LADVAKLECVEHLCRSLKNTHMNDPDAWLHKAERETAGNMTGGDPQRHSGQHDDGAVRFAPNFSVYILPPDAVCLYSEDRKFFLQGELYCALAARIGAGERLGDIFRALAGEYPAAEIDEAFKRLHQRRFIVPASAAEEPAAAYWVALGLKGEAAAENLRKIRVRIESMGADGANELAVALRAFAVSVVDRSAELTVVLVDDYLDERLAEFNSKCLSQRQEWLPVQVSGVFPIVGPIFSPGKSACWTCLADRMKRNRQIKAFLDEKQARRVATSPLSKGWLGRSGIEFAAVEISKAIASGFRTDLHHHLVSLDLMGSTVARHYLPARPQCPSCGSRELRDPERAPAPIRLRAGGRMVVTSGGYRSVMPGETVARFRKHVSPLTGVVSRLERIKGDQPLDASFLARHNFSPRPETIDALIAGLSADSYGKGSTAEQGEASALMEAIERYSGIFEGDEIRITRRFVDFPPGDAILPNDILLLSDAQLDRSPQGASYSGAGDQRRFDATAETEWSPAWSLRDERFKYIPTGLLYFFHSGPGKNQISADSNGCAAGNTLEEAILQGFLELVERDAYAIWWYNRLHRTEIDLEKIGDSHIRDLLAQFAAMGRRVWALDVTTDLGIPVVAAVANWTEDSREHIELAAGAHFEPRIAALRAMTELNQFMAIDSMRRRPGDQTEHDSLPLPVRKHAYVLPHGRSSMGGARFAKFSKLDRRQQVLACVKLVKRFGLDFLVLDQTRPDIEVPVVRVIVPGLRHFYRRFGPGRLYEVPLSLGLRKRPLREADLNPLHPRT
jgi:bacteriocin biosynthesis cyclodehydratase domain-containing protein